MRLIVVVMALIFAGEVFAGNVATVVRAHPYLTRGVDRESLLGIRFDGGWGGQVAANQVLDFRFDFTNCESSVISEVKIEYIPHSGSSLGGVYARPYAYYSGDAKAITYTKTENAAQDGSSLEVSFSGMTHSFYPNTPANGDSGYIWLTAAISPDIPDDAEIWVTLVTDKITINGCAFEVTNGVAKAPHRVLKNRYQIAAYLRQDWMSASNAYGLENSTSNRIANLTDIILVNNLRVKYDADSDSFKTSWTDNDAASTMRVINYRNLYNPDCRVRLSLTRGWEYTTVGGVLGYPLACATLNDTYRSKLVAEVIRILEEVGVDGLDIDYEYPGVHQSAKISDEMVWRDWHGYGLFLRDLAAEFFDRGWVLSICSNESGWCMAPSGMYSAMHAADMIESMAYDYHTGSYPLHCSAQAMKYAMSVLTNRGISKRRVMAGQAMYSNWNYQPGWGTIVGWIGENFDRDTYPQGSGYATFESPTTYHAKCDYARRENYGGVMSWGYYTDVAWNNRMSLARHQAKAIWPVPYSWPTPEQDEKGVYLLKSEADFFWLRDHTNVSARFVQDIVLEHDPLPVESFSGTIDGNGHRLTIPWDTWIVTEGQTALFKVLYGSIKNLTIDFSGRAVTCAARWNDTSEGPTANTIGELYNNCGTAVLVGSLAAGGTLQNVELNLLFGSEVQGARKAGGLMSDIYSTNDSLPTIVSNCMVNVEGTIHTQYRNSWEGTYSMAYSCAGAIAAWMGGSGDIRVVNNEIFLGNHAELKAEHGTNCAVAGAIGDLNNSGLIISGLKVYVSQRATIAQADGSCNASPAYTVGSYFLANNADVGLSALVSLEDRGVVLERGFAGVIITNVPPRITSLRLLLR